MLDSLDHNGSLTNATISGSFIHSNGNYTGVVVGWINGSVTNISSNASFSSSNT